MTEIIWCPEKADRSVAGYKMLNCGNNRKQVRTVRLKDLLLRLPVKEFWGDGNTEITAVEYDSRAVGPGALFIALRGSKADGHDYMSEALTRGAVAVLAEETRDLEGRVNLILVPDTRKVLPLVGKVFYQDPAARLNLLGVVGTNGKTTSTFLLHSILKEAFNRAGLIGTIHHLLGERTEPAGNTTPGALDLQRLFAEMVKNEVKFAVMEVSSHALALGRVEGLSFAGGLFTNITRDHLDFHGTFDEYLQVKSSFFKGLAPEAAAVINIDDPYGPYIIRCTRARKLTYGFAPEADIRAEEVTMTMKESTFTACTPWGKRTLRLSLPGKFNVYNALGALGLSLALNVELDTACRGVEKLTGVPGRFEVVPGGKDFTVVVDYAHTPDGLANVLRTARSLAKNRVFVVFGCGGDRDRGKRREMGRIAALLSDFSIVTSDNPRSEDPAAIAGEIAEGFQKTDAAGRYRIILDREQAIREAINLAGPGDMVIIAGKGHETYQIFKDRTLYFNDRETAAAALKERNHG